ncbi:MAG: GNAT family N-acetyltransferase [Ignavibacteriaceae bacterium]
MNNEVKHDETNMNFSIKLNGKESSLKYRLKGSNTIEMFSTYVPEEHRNKGLASKMAVEALSFARNKNLKVIPTCSFMRDFISRNKEYEDMVK